MVALISFSGYLVVGDRSWAMRCRTAIFLADLTGIEIKVPSEGENWPISTFALSTGAKSNQPSYSKWLKSGSKEVAQRN